jgi:hypothetical protein
MYTKDLSIYNYNTYFPLVAVRCVGWLDSEHEYSKGLPPEGFLEKLRIIVTHETPFFNIHVNLLRSNRPCNLCHQAIKILSPWDSIHLFSLGMSEIWIPDVSGWFAAPSLIYHYIESHGYLPPSCFVEAVFALQTEKHFIAEDIYDCLIRSPVEGREGTSLDSEGSET